MDDPQEVQGSSRSPSRVRRWRLGAVAAALALAVLGSSAWAGADRLVGHRPLNPPDAPQAIGPYSQGISTGQMVFVSGQLPIDPSTGKLLADAPVEEQTRQVLRNVRAVLAADHLEMAQVVSTTVYLSDLADFERFNAAYAEFFTEGAPPARATVQVVRVPKDAKVEISAIAVR
ncbi:Rid family detoxifying hydrolase [Saccharopolyspora oryzae]|uniref:Rid family detoxifying hydrolase n=1 Tax=Saccharopolyspora oryzae TaxID=2997343 RepID=UPI002FDBF7BF